MIEPGPTFSPRGEHRRRQILAIALAAAGKRRRRILALRAGALVLISGLVMLPILLTHKSSPSSVVKSYPTPAAPQPSAQLAGVALIPTDPTIVERLSIPHRPSMVVAIRDDELLAGLAQAHRPAGLAYVNGKATLLFR